MLGSRQSAVGGRQAAGGRRQAAVGGRWSATTAFMASEPKEEVLARIRALRAKAAELESRLSEEQFLGLPAKLQNQLAVLQTQSEPSGDGYEALLAAEHNLRTYNERLLQAQNLAAQLTGARRWSQAALGRRLMVLGIWLLVLGALAGGGYWFTTSVLLPKKAAVCQSSPACQADGRCGAGLKVELPTVQLVCEPTADEHCRAAERCSAKGECFAATGRCVAKDNEDCRKTEGCRADGLCSALDGHCAAATREDCGPTVRCAERGECTPQQGVCAVLSDEDCKRSVACKRFGACTELQGKCVKLEE